MTKIVPSSSKGGDGNSSPPKSKQVSAKRHWCFTLNNYTKENIRSICSISSKNNLSYIFQEETGETGTKHLQGYIAWRAKSKGRPLGLFNIPTIHWTGCRNVEASIKYCCKEETRTGEIYSNFYEPIITLSENQLYKWQKKIIKIIEGPVDPRLVHWYYEKKGGAGKSEFARYLCIKYNCIMLSGKPADMKCGVSAYVEKNGHGPKVIVVDIPRSQPLNHISMPGLETIKNGAFFNTKYESGMCIYNRPHIFCFANVKPNKELLSKDKWKIRRIK